MHAEVDRSRTKTSDHCFSSAAAILEDRSMTTTEKLLVLRAMEADARRAEKAANDAARSATLVEILRAIGVLEENRRHAVLL